MGNRFIVLAGFGYTATDSNPAWTDITRYADINEGIQIGRGAQDELSDVQPGTCRLTLNNEDGRFTSGNASSPYFPNVRKGVPIRVRVVSADKNLVTNPSFESGLSDWSKSNSPSYATDATRAVAGTQSMLLSFAGGVTSQNVTTICYGLDIGQAYTYSVYVWVPAGNASVRIQVEDMELNTLVAASPTSTVAGAWQRLSVTFTATGTQHRLVVIAPGAPTAGDQVWIDAVQVEEGSAATAFNLLSNCSFETDTSGWSSSGGPTLARVTDHAWDGGASMLVTWDGAAGVYAATTVSNLVAGATYTASAYVWVPAGGTPVLLRAAGVVSGTASTVTGSWQRISVTWTQPSGTTRQVNVQPSTTATAGQQVWVDAVQIEEGSTATAFGSSDGAGITSRFYGMVNEWPLAWNGLESTTTITATDLFKWLGMQRQLRPMLVEEMLQDSPRAYYPMSEGTDSTTLGDISGYGTGSLAVFQAGSGGTIEFGAGGGPADSLGCPKFTPASATAGKYLRASLGTRFTDAANAAGSNMLIEFWFATTVGNRHILSLGNADSSSQIRFRVDINNQLNVNAATNGEFSVGPDVFGSSLNDGAVHHVVADLNANRLWLDGADMGTGSYFITPMDPSRLWIGAAGPAPGSQETGTEFLWAGTIAQVAIYVGGSTTASDLTAHYTTGHSEQIGEAANQRAARIAGYIGMPVNTSGSTFDGMASQKALGRTALEHLREIAQTESGRVYINRVTGGLTLQSRDVRYNPSATLTVDYADLETGDVDLADDDQKMVNTVEATRPGGATQRVSNKTARALYGPYEQQIDLFKSTDTKVLDAANWLVSRYADPPPELRHVPLEIYSLPLETYRAALNVDISSMITVNNLPAQAPTSSATVFVEGYTETISQNRHVIDFYTSRASTDTVWVLGDATYGALDTSTRLAY